MLATDTAARAKRPHEVTGVEEHVGRCQQRHWQVEHAEEAGELEGRAAPPSTIDGDCGTATSSNIRPASDSTSPHNDSTREIRVPTDLVTQVRVECCS